MGKGGYKLKLASYGDYQTEVVFPVITAIYLLGILCHAWGFGWWYGLAAVLVDCLMNPIVRVGKKTNR